MRIATSSNSHPVRLAIRNEIPSRLWAFKVGYERATFQIKINLAIVGNLPRITARGGTLRSGIGTRRYPQDPTTRVAGIGKRPVETTCGFDPVSQLDAMARMAKVS